MNYIHSNHAVIYLIQLYALLESLSIIPLHLAVIEQYMITWTQKAFIHKRTVKLAKRYSWFYVMGLTCLIKRKVFIFITYTLLQLDERRATKLGILTDSVILQQYSRRILCRICPAAVIGLSHVFHF